MHRPAVGQDTVDHEEGIEAVILERSAVLRRPGQLLDGVPLHVNGQVSKDKGTLSLQVPSLSFPSAPLRLQIKFMVSISHACVCCATQSELESSVFHSSRIISTLGSQYMTLDAGDAMWVGSAETRLGYVPRTKVSAGLLAARLVEDGGLPTKVRATRKTSKCSGIVLELQVLAALGSEHHWCEGFEACLMEDGRLLTENLAGLAANGDPMLEVRAAVWNVQGPLARGIKVGSSVRLADGAKLKGGAAKIACKTRMGQDKAQAAQSLARCLGALTASHLHEQLSRLSGPPCRHVKLGKHSGMHLLAYHEPRAAMPLPFCKFVLFHRLPAELHVRTQGDAPFTRRGRRRHAGGSDNLQRVFVLGASLLNFRNDKALVGNASAQLPLTPQTQVALRGNVSNKGSGAITLHLTSHDIPQLGLVLLVPAMSKGISQLKQRFGNGY
ncbi:hypothetical protein MMC29_003637 [Sticta canariensis]|nr:hypothetical protein [Sticta canariensis]